MSTLPSREALARAIAGDVFVTSVDPPELWTVLYAYVSGRLVDRETIELDWETNPDWSLQWVTLESDGAAVTTLGIVPL